MIEKVGFDDFGWKRSARSGAVAGITFAMGGTQLTAASGVTWQPMDTALASWIASNELANTLSYDSDGRLTGISVPGVEALAYRYDAANRLTGIANAIDGTLSQDFGYDEQSRLVAMSSLNQDASYSYDADGNRITGVTHAGTSNTSYSASSNRLVSTTGASPQRYGYDVLGNVTALNGVTAYQYDAFNRLSAAAGTSYYVNPEGQRLRKSGGAGTTYFAPSASGTLLAEDDNGSWIDYVWLGGRLIGREVNGQLEAIGDDQLGRPQVVTNASQSVVWSAQNWPFTRSVAVSSSAPLNLGFPGQYYDQETGLWNNGFRDYDPTLGRYVESDPTGLNGGINTYAYVNGNPISNVDPRGLWVVALGFGGTVGHFLGITGGTGIVFDSSGNYGTYTTYGGGLSSRQNASVGVTGSFFGSSGDDATTITDFGGPFYNGSLGGGADGLTGGIDGYVDPNNPTHWGGGFSLGVGTTGGSAFAGKTCTQVTQQGNLLWELMNHAFTGSW